VLDLLGYFLKKCIKMLKRDNVISLKICKVNKNLKFMAKGRPVFNPDAVLAHDQKCLVVGTLVSDGWLELLAGGRNPRIGLQQCDRNKSLIIWWMGKLRLFIRQDEPSLVLKKAPNALEPTKGYYFNAGIN
jgi:hypothetical protein